jgi:hypothetical protein
LSSQLQKAKADGNAAVEKLKKSEENLAQIKEKNAQLSDELLNKSRQVCRGQCLQHTYKVFTGTFLFILGLYFICGRKLAQILLLKSW